MTTVADFDPSLHPRDGHGKFSAKGHMDLLTEAEKALGNRTVDQLRPKKFGSDGEAAQYLQHNAPDLPAELEDAVNRYTGDTFFDLNRKLRSGDASDLEVGRLDAAMRPTPDDMILTRHVGPEAFGLSPSSLVSVEMLAGRKIVDPAYSSTALGRPYGGGLGGVTMHILTPKGTPAVFASAVSRNPHEREVLLARGLEFAVARVVRNDRYGYDMYVIALPKEG